MAKKKWIWDRTRIILKNPKGEEVTLTSEDLNDETMNEIFNDIEEYVETFDISNLKRPHITETKPAYSDIIWAIK